MYVGVGFVAGMVEVEIKMERDARAYSFREFRG